MSLYNKLPYELRIKLARDAVRFNIPIAPAIVTWLHEQGLHEQIINPRKSNAGIQSTNASEGSVSESAA